MTLSNATYDIEVLNYDNYNASLVHDYINNNRLFIVSNMNRCDHNGHTLMHIACTYNDIETVKFLIDDGNKQTVNAIDSNGWNPLRTVSHFGYIELLKILLETKHCNVNDAYNNRTALFYASLSCHTDVVKVLLNYDAKMYVNNTIQIASNCNYDKYCNEYFHMHNIACCFPTA